MLERVTVVIDVLGRDDKVTCGMGSCGFRPTLTLCSWLTLTSSCSCGSAAPPYKQKRVDILTFIAGNRKLLETGSHAYLLARVPLRSNAMDAQFYTTNTTALFLEYLTSKNHYVPFSGILGWSWVV